MFSRWRSLFFISPFNLSSLLSCFWLYFSSVWTNSLAGGCFFFFFLFRWILCFSLVILELQCFFLEILDDYSVFSLSLFLFGCLRLWIDFELCIFTCMCDYNVCLSMCMSWVHFSFWAHFWAMRPDPIVWWQLLSSYLAHIMCMLSFINDSLGLKFVCWSIFFSFFVFTWVFLDLHQVLLGRFVWYFTVVWMKNCIFMALCLVFVLTCMVGCYWN